MVRAWKPTAKYLGQLVDVCIYPWQQDQRGVRFEDGHVEYVAASDLEYLPPKRLKELAHGQPQINPDFKPFWSRSMGVAPWEAREGKGLPTETYDHRSGSVLVRDRRHQAELMSRLGYRTP